MIPAAELARARADMEQLLTESCDVQRPGSVGDGVGGTVVDFETVLTVLCRIAVSPVPGWEKTVAGQIKAHGIWLVRVPFDALIKEQDVLLIGSRRLEVQSAGAGTRALTQVIQCVEVL